MHMLIAPRRSTRPRVVSSCFFRMTANEDFATGATVKENTPADTFVIAPTIAPFFTTRSDASSSTSSGTPSTSIRLSGAAVNESVTSTFPSTL